MKLTDKLLKPFKSIRNFLYTRYVKFVEMVTLYMLARSTKLVDKMILLKGRDFSDPYTSWMLNRTGTLVRAALVAQGKDPDYVAPPPPPAKPVEVAKPRPFYSGAPTNIGAAWIHDPSKHPVLDSRKQFEEKQAKLKAQLQAVPTLEEELAALEEPEVLQVAAAFDLPPSEGQDEEPKQISEE